MTRCTSQTDVKRSGMYDNSQAFVDEEVSDQVKTRKQIAELNAQKKSLQQPNLANSVSSRLQLNKLRLNLEEASDRFVKDLTQS